MSKTLVICYVNYVCNQNVYFLDYKRENLEGAALRISEGEYGGQTDLDQGNQSINQSI